MKRLFILFVAATLVCTSCDKDDDTAIAQEEVQFPDIIGVWEWVETSGGIEDDTDSPESSGITRDIIITPTNFEFYIDDILFADRAYTFTLEQSLLTGEEEFIVTFLDDDFKDIVQKEGDVITFIDDCVDCFISVYRLKN